ncbi:hypothetical protein GCM10010381_54090 [Streptomyces xantholiticus]|nr:hypothetical protein GCM10010381_54090 [Streptomyces xantholiticus]
MSLPAAGLVLAISVVRDLTGAGRKDADADTDTTGIEDSVTRPYDRGNGPVPVHFGGQFRPAEHKLSGPKRCRPCATGRAERAPAARSASRWIH